MLDLVPQASLQSGQFLWSGGLQFLSVSMSLRGRRETKALSGKLTSLLLPCSLDLVGFVITVRRGHMHKQHLQTHFHFSFFSFDLDNFVKKTT